VPGPPVIVIGLEYVSSAVSS